MVPDDENLAAQDLSESLISRARAGIQGWIKRARDGLAPLTPQAVLMSLTAAALTPILVPLLEGAGGAVAIQQALGQLGAIGAGHLVNVIDDVVTRLRREKRETTTSEETVRQVLQTRLEDVAGAEGTRSAEVMAEAAQLLGKIDGIGAALDAAVRDNNAELYARISEAVTELSAQHAAEFRSLYEDMLTALESHERKLSQISVRQQDDSEKLDRIFTVLLLSRRDARRSVTAALGAPFAARPGEDDANPYPGLAAFTADDARWFHGRGLLTGRLVSQLRGRLYRPSPLIVYGASGAGKSSLLSAGLIPELDAGSLAEPGSESWPRLRITPGRKPLLELASPLATLAGLRADDVREWLAADPLQAAVIARQAARTGWEPHRDRTRGAIGEPAPQRSDGTGDPPVRRLIVLIDQFEEIFTQCADEDERKQFVDAVCAMSGQPRGDPAALVVIGLRAEFVGHCTAHSGLGPALLAPVVIGPMSVPELRSAIERPARDAGAEVEEGLVEVMLGDLGAEPSPGDDGDLPGDDDPAGGLLTYDPGRLPLLAHALRETWDRRQDSDGKPRLTIAGYTDAGGITKAVANKADKIYCALGENERRLAQQLLLHMVAVRADTEDARRQVSRDELLAEFPQADQPAAERILAELEAERLVTGDRETVQIVHEALLQHWPRLRDWLRFNREWLEARQRLIDHAREWTSGIREQLYQGVQLQAFQEHAEAALRQLNPGLTRIRKAELGEFRRRELGDLGERFLRASERLQLRSTLKRRLLAGTGIGVAVALSVLGIVADADSQTARHQQAIATAGQMVADSDALRPSDPERSVLLSLEAYRIEPQQETISNLLSAQADYFTSHLNDGPGAVNAVAYDPSGTTLAAAGESNGVTLWDTATGMREHTLPVATALYGLAFDPAAALLAGAGSDGTVTLWDTRTRLRTRTLTQDSAAVDSVAFSPDGTVLASTGDDGMITLWRTRTWTSDVLRVGDGPVNSVAFSPDGRLLAAACADGDVRIWNLARPRALPQVFAGNGGPVRAVAFSRDGKMLASGGDDGTVRVWDAHSGASRDVFSSTAKVRAVAFSPDGSQLASGGNDDAVRLWDVRTGTQDAALSGPLNAVSGVAFSPDGQTLASADADATVGLWSLAGPAVPPNTSTGLVATAAGTASGLIATASTPREVSLWRAPWHAGSALHGAAVPGGRFAMALSPGGSTLATAAGTDQITLWSVAQRRRIRMLRAPAPVNTLAYSPGPDGTSILAAGCGNDEVYVWAAGAAQSQPLIIHQLEAITAVAFSPDGKILASASDDGTIQLTDIRAPGGNVFSALSGHLGAVESIAFSPDGHTLASASADDTVRLWNITDPRHPDLLAILTGHTQAVVSVAFGRGGMLATSGDDRTIELWDVRDPRHPAQLATLTGLSSVTTVAFGPDGQVIGATSDATAQFWDTDPDKVAARICATRPAGSLVRPYIAGKDYRSLCPDPAG
ncbi:MAG TPA: hypothetical protein VF070_25790 [Streptosporangiaceae bacterium]